MGGCETPKEMKLTGPLKLYPNSKSSIKVFRDRETYAISWEDENNLIPKKMKRKIQYSLQQTDSEAISNGLFRSISDSFWNVPPEAQPFFRELMLPMSTNVCVDLKGELSTTPLMICAKLGAEKAVFILIGRAAKMEEVDDYYWTALHWATWERSEPACEVLLNKGANINAQNADGSTALMMAALNGEVELVKLFLKYGADTKIEDKHANAALKIATQKCAEIIKAHQRKTEEAEKDGYSELHWAAAFGNESTCRKLLRLGANILAQDKHGNTSLMVAAVNGYAEIVRILLKSRADVKATNKWGKTALDYATEKCADIIRAHEAKLKN